MISAGIYYLCIYMYILLFLFIYGLRPLPTALNRVRWLEGLEAEVWRRRCGGNKYGVITSPFWLKAFSLSRARACKLTSSSSGGRIMDSFDELAMDGQIVGHD